MARSFVTNAFHPTLSEVGEKAMAKKKRQGNSQRSDLNNQENTITLGDQLQGDVLEKLKAAKKGLIVQEREKEEERQAKLAFERKQREKNMSFEELLEKYGDNGSKF